MVKLTDTGTESVVYERTFELGGGQDIETNNIVDGGEYDVQAVVDEKRTVTETLAAPCPNTSFHIIIRELAVAR